MKKLDPKVLRKKAVAVSNKDERKQTILCLRAINKVIKQRARKGHTYISRTSGALSYQGWITYKAVRWMRINSKLKVEIFETFDDYSKTSAPETRVVESFHYRISWS